MCPIAAEENKYVQLFKSRVAKATFDKTVRILDEAIRSINPSKKSALNFAMLATLVGHNCVTPTRDSNYVWETVFRAAKQHDRTGNYILGCLAMWRFCLDDRDWNAFKQDTGIENELGEEITRTVYWVSEKVQKPPPPKRGMRSLGSELQKVMGRA